MIKGIINFAAKISFILAVFMLVISGLLYSTSAGDSQKIDLAKRAVYYTLLGLFIVFLAWLIIAVLLKAIGYDGIGTWNQVNCGLGD
jgi:preprotein translocase subunit SecG